MAIYRPDGMREVKARKAYKCANCGGTIDRDEIYLNYHKTEADNWQGRQHFSCEAAWWQGDATHLLSAVSKLPGQNPPSEAILPALEGIPVSVQVQSAAGSIHTVLEPTYAQRVLHTPNLQLRKEALTQIGRAQALFTECLQATSGQQQLSLQMSHLLQQMAQLANIEPYRS